MIICLFIKSNNSNIAEKIRFFFNLLTSNKSTIFLKQLFAIITLIKLSSPFKTMLLINLTTCKSKIFSLSFVISTILGIKSLWIAQYLNLCLIRFFYFTIIIDKKFFYFYFRKYPWDFKQWQIISVIICLVDLIL